MPRVSKPGEEVINSMYTNKIFLMAEQKRLIQKFRHLFTMSAVETSPCYSNYRSFLFHSSNRVSINHLEAAPNTMLLGRVVFCRTIVPSVQSHSLLTIVEFPDADLNDKALFFSLYDYQHSLDEDNEESIPDFPIGTILAVVNPFLFHPATDQICTMKCDNPSDITVLSQNEFERLFPGLKWPSGEVKNNDLAICGKLWPHKAGDFMSVGNYWLKRKNYVGAIQAYSLALFHSNDFDALTLRCSLYLRLKLYKKSLKDSEKILDIIPFHDKAICYRASSLIGLGNYAKAKEFIEIVIQRCELPVDSVQKERLIDLLLKTEAWSKQESDGDYDVVQMLSCSMNHHHDCADYIGSVVEQNVPGKGRGMIATENIKCGDLIVGAKALEIVTYSQKKEKQNWPIETITQGAQYNARVRLFSAVAHRLIRDPETAKSFYNLFDGTKISSAPNTDKPDYECINMKKVAAICDYNLFAQCYKGGSAEEYFVVGLWPPASLFNHGGYDSNSSWEICENFMFVRATRDIVKGDEVTCLYTPFIEEYSERIKTLSHYDFSCNCTLCLLDSEETTATSKRREEILQQIIYLESKPVVSTNILARLIEELQQQYPDNPQRWVYTIRPKMRLAHIYMRVEEYSKASQIVRDVYQFTSKTALTHSSLLCCYDGMICAINGKEFENVNFWASALKTSLIQTYGVSSNELLQCVAPNVAQSMAEYNIVL